MKKNYIFRSNFISFIQKVKEVRPLVIIEAAILCDTPSGIFTAICAGKILSSAYELGDPPAYATLSPTLKSFTLEPISIIFLLPLIQFHLVNSKGINLIGDKYQI